MDDDLKFPSGISVSQLKRDARKLSNTAGIALTEARDQLAIKHAKLPYDIALIAARREAQKSAPPPVDFDWRVVVGDLDHAHARMNARLAVGEPVRVTGRPYEADQLINTLSEMQGWFANLLRDPFDFGEEQARAKVAINPPSVISSSSAELLDFVKGYVQRESGGLAGNKADLFAKYGAELGLPKEPFLDELEDRPEAYNHLNAIWRGPAL